MKVNYFLPVVLSCLLFMILLGCKNGQHDSLKTEKITTEKRIINPWTWQDKYGFVQSNEVTNFQRILFTAGIVSVDREGNLLHGGDMEKQMNQIINNMEVLLEQANFELSDVVRFTYYTTDVNGFTKASKNGLIKRLKSSDCKPATSLIGVKSLFHPDCLVEIEAIVVK